jgi:AcrR family transcriptional regulator
MSERFAHLNKLRNTSLSRGNKAERTDEKTDARSKTRRRRKPEAAQNEILDAAEAFLREHPFREMTVEDVMSRTGLSRPSFYEYFRDRHHLVIKLVERFGSSTYALAEQWLSGQGDPLNDLQEGAERLVAMYAERGYLLRALADAASHDGEVEQAYRATINRLIEAAAARIRAGIEKGMVKNIDPSEVAAALVLMNERYLMERLWNQPKADPRAVADTIVAVWRRVLYAA